MFLLPNHKTIFSLNRSVEMEQEKTFIDLLTIGISFRLISTIYYIAVLIAVYALLSLIEIFLSILNRWFLERSVPRRTMQGTKCQIYARTHTHIITKFQIKLISLVTRKACQNRVLYVWKNSENQQNVYVLLELPRIMWIGSKERLMFHRKIC